jgi:endonuclease/exonuclease/phosphatase (EEP) superfamily protein YafD
MKLGGLTVRRVLEVTTVLLLGAPLVIALAALSNSGHRWPDILAQFTVPALLATALLMVAAMLARLRIAAGVGALASALLIFAVGPQVSPAGPRPRTDTAIVRLYSANLYYRNDDVAAIRRSIEAADADIVVLIELGQGPAAQIDEILAGYPHRAASMRLDQTRGPSRSVIASRWPLTQWPDRPDGLHDVGVVVRTPLGPLNVVGVHLTRPWPFQYQWGQISQTMALDKVVNGLTGPVIVAGDFNSVSTGRIGRQVKGDIGLHPAPGYPGTWPDDLPAPLGMTIDQVYASPDLAFVSRRLGRPSGSDHRPVVTEVTRARP